MEVFAYEGLQGMKLEGDSKVSECKSRLERKPETLVCSLNSFRLLPTDL
jgi:hypothetical protein